jgi:hypothetical protein
LIMDSGKIVFDGSAEEAWEKSPQFNFLFNKASMGNSLKCA